ncbi:outer membrane lipoprotein carrier protein LolA [bacterium]|nr:outer membrane lipoprotein carrier protein LolA [bacterium]
MPLPLKRNLDLILALCVSLALPVIGEDFVENEDDLPPATNVVLKIEDKHLNEIISGIENSARHTRTYCAHFHQCEYSKYDVPGAETSGRFYLERQRYSAEDDEKPKLYFRMRFEYFQPKAAVTILDGANLYSLRQGKKEAQTLLVDNRKIEVAFAGFMSMKELLEHFSVSIAAENAKEVALELTPSSEMARRLFASVRLTFDKLSYLPTSVTQNRHDGARNLFILAKPQRNVIFESRTFEPAFMKDFIKLHYVKPPPMVSVTNITPCVVTNNVFYTVTNTLLTAQGEIEDICQAVRTEIKDAVITNITKVPAKAQSERLLPL